MFTVYDSKPSNPQISTDKKVYYTGEKVTFDFSVKNATEMYIPIDVNGKREYWNDVTGKTSYITSFEEIGTYGYFLHGVNDYGTTDIDYHSFCVIDDDNNGHDYKTTIFAPTCTEKGYSLHSCSVCGDNYKDTYTNATGHDFGEWIVITVPTSTNAGEEQRICSICGAVEKRSLVLKHVPGDINNDGVVNNKDFSRLFQYLSGWNVVVNEAALDVNGDGSVNNKDATRLFQYVSGWNVNIY